MAQSTVGSLISIAAVSGLAWWAYEHFFAGPAVSTLPPAPGGPAGGGAGTNLVPNPNPPVSPAAPTPPAGPCSGSGVLALILSAVQADKGDAYGPNLPGTLMIDEWDFYGNRICTGMMDQFGVNADTLFPGADDRGGPLNWNAFAGHAKQRGLSGHHYGRRPQLIGTHLARPWGSA